MQLRIVSEHTTARKRDPDNGRTARKSQSKLCHTTIEGLHSHTTNEGLVRIQYECLVPIYVFPEMKLCGLSISHTEL
jgi:hypothetical protein